MKSLARSAVAATLLATVLLGCSSDDDGDTTLTTPDTTASTTVSATEPDGSAAPDGSGGEGTTGTGAGEDDVAEFDDVCPLLEGIDLDKALGEPAGEPTATREQCTVLGVNTDSPASINISFIPAGGEDRFHMQNELYGMSPDDEDDGDGSIDGLGDEALKDGATIHARKGDQFLRVQVLRSPLGDEGQMTSDDLISLARTVATNAGW